jgi:hypothetical protein
MWVDHVPFPRRRIQALASYLFGCSITAKIAESPSQEFEMWFQFFDGSFKQARGLREGRGDVVPRGEFRAGCYELWEGRNFSSRTANGYDLEPTLFG